MSADIIVCESLTRTIRKVHQTQEKTQSSQIKGEFQLKKLNEAVECITKNLTSTRQEGKKKRKL